MTLTDDLGSSKNKAVKRLGWVMKQAALFTWFFFSWIAIPIPVKTTAIVGEPLYFKKDDDLKVIAETCRKALQDLINKHQPHKHTYMTGLRERFGFVTYNPETCELIENTNQLDKESKKEK